MLKILAGEFRSRRLHTPPNDTTRPYAGRARDSVFGMLREWFEGARVLDLYAGVGTVGLEAVSRGAERVVMVERDRRIFEFLRKNIEELGCQDRVDAILGDALSVASLARAARPVDMLFADPPYATMRDEASRRRVLAHLERARPILADPSFVILRTPLNPNVVPHEIDGYDGPEAHQYRPDMWVLFYQPRGDDAADNPADAGDDRTE